ncbi:MAG: arsenate reductase (glutaredoxin) [Campylobacterota bacterium]|nr:arsenate reductase (glutaredoxin) [Campylobacterota bacterium]
MNNITIWHNPRCSKSREAMSILEENNCTTKVIKYLDSKPTVDEIKDILKMLELSPRELMRTKEEIYKELNLKDEEDEDRLIQAMATHQKLIERPIIIKGDRAIIGRPTSKIAEFLNS